MFYFLESAEPRTVTQRRRPLAAQVPRSHSRATDQSSEFRTPALDRGNSSFFLSLSSFPTPSPFIFYFYPSHQPLSSPRPASTGGSQLGSLSFQMTINPNSKRRRQCSIEGSGNNKEEGGLWNIWEFLVCMKPSPITDRKAERPKISACIRNLTRFFFPGISRAQNTPLSAAAPSLHRFLARIPEPHIRVPNSAHLLLIAGISSFSFPLSDSGDFTALKS